MLNSIPPFPQQASDPGLSHRRPNRSAEPTESSPKVTLAETRPDPPFRTGKPKPNTSQRYTLVYTASQDQVPTPTRRPPFTFRASPSQQHPMDTWGHEMSPIETHSTFRILFQNPNGIHPTPTNFEFLRSLQSCKDHGISTFGLAETNLNWNQRHVTENLRQSMAKIWNISSVQTSGSPECFESMYQPGGTLSAVCERWSMRIAEKGSDPSGLGRWSFITLRGKRTTRVTIITAYRVCHQVNSGATTANMQQYREILRSKQLATPSINPRRQCVLDLQHFILQKQDSGHDIILLIDANEGVDSTTGASVSIAAEHDSGKFQYTVSPTHDGRMSTLVKSCSLVDLVAYHHSPCHPPATYHRGTKRLDYIFVSARIQQCAIRSGILPYYTFFYGDHRPIFADFDATALFGDFTGEILGPQGRGLQLKDPRVVDKYRAALCAQLSYHKLYDKAFTLQQQAKAQHWTAELGEKYEKVDRLITEAMLHAEKSASKRFSKRFQWSPALVQLVCAVRYWTLRLKAAKGLRCSSIQIDNNRLGGCIPIEASLIASIPQILDRLKAARAAMRKNQKHHILLRQEYLTDLADAIVLRKLPWLSEPQYVGLREERLAMKVRDLQAREKQRAMFNKIRRFISPCIKKQKSALGLSRVDVPETDLDPQVMQTFGDPSNPATWTGPWRSITNPAEIERLIRRQNIKIKRATVPLAPAA